jgi:formate-dependent nitrite reductase cytochrome c552 subunit
MPQLFTNNANAVARASIIVGVVLALVVVWAWWQLNRSGYNTGQFLEYQQPVQFSHKHHVGDDGIDCRYCHTSVENAASAGMPPTQTCMNCHTQIWSDSPYLAPVRNSYANNQPIQWRRVHDLPDYVYFNHSIHVKKGVGCSSCHGRIDEMGSVYQKSSLQMSWCLDCHKDPGRFIREINKDDNSAIYDMTWRAGNDGERTSGEDAEKGRKLAAEYKVKSREAMTSCSTCHR